jgi:LPS-assembly lipoprotein
MTQIKSMGIQGILLLILLTISGCGFHLRGAIELPALYERVYLVDKGYSDIGNPLASSLKAAGSEMVSSADAATSVITLLSRGAQRKALNVGGKEIKEYELQLDVAFVVQDHEGKQLSEQQTVSLVRSFRNDPNDVLGKDNEETLIRKEMNQAVVRQILRRLKAIAN